MDVPQDGLKWFGEGFDGFPKRLPEDCVEYSLYIIDSKLKDPAQVRQSLLDIQAAATALKKGLLRDYIWQREGFELAIQRADGLTFLQGRTNFGDSVEDEWLIVYILRELSKKFEALWIRVVDTDGEFLLIEAANALPRWLNPEVADNRVWIHDGKLFIIPQEPLHTESKEARLPSRTITPKEALAAISKNFSKLIHSPLIESEAFYRLQKYPQQIADNFHFARIVVPRKLAYILHEKPAYISAAIEAFYLRDPISLKPLQSKGQVGLKFPPEDLVAISTKFTKVGYAQLKSQQFSAPKAWQEKLPKEAQTTESNQAEIGMKVACGFEMLLADPQNQDKISVREIKVLLEDVESGEEKLPSDADIRSWGRKEDDEKWLDINFEDFETELAGKRAERGGGVRASASTDGFGDKAAQENLRKMVSRFEQFLNDDSAGAEGAEFLDDMDFDDEDDEDDEESSEVSSEGEDKDVSFDEEEFTRMMREMMGIPVEATKDNASSTTRETDTKASRVVELDAEDAEDAGDAEDVENEEDEGKALQDLMQRMEAELKESGALNLDPPVEKTAAKKEAIQARQKSHSGKETEKRNENLDDDDEGSDSDGAVDIDFNLAKNLLESFKGQAGLAGPGGNLMGMLGLQMPRDEDGNEGSSG
ncbi:MAG: hypothetical protein M1819_003054 [Sarea resinae]|nr:MAG: hypothetical protein M1819_003054 [Sarea resinae]